MKTKSILIATALILCSAGMVSYAKLKTPSLERLNYYATGQVIEASQTVGTWERWGNAAGSYRTETTYNDGRRATDIAIVGKGLFSVKADRIEVLGAHSPTDAEFVAAMNAAKRHGSHFGLESYFVQSQIPSGTAETWIIPALGMQATAIITDKDGLQTGMITDSVSLVPIDPARFELPSLPLSTKAMERRAQNFEGRANARAQELRTTAGQIKKAN